MVSLFQGLHIAAGALDVNESAISVVAHNVANMNTVGYSKQRVHLATRNIAGAIGDNVHNQIRANGGVMISNVMRYNDAYLNNYYRQQLSKLNELESLVGDVGDLADIFNDLDGQGIDGALKNFYEALNNLQQYPASSAARVNFIESARTLGATLNSKSEQLGQLSTQVLGDGESEEALKNSKIYYQFGLFNDKLKELAEVNKALQLTQTGTLEANNLLDKRDLILNDIAKYVDINIEEKENGTVNLFVGNVALVRGSVVKGELSIKTAKQYCEENGIDYPDGWVDADGNPREAVVFGIVKQENGVTETVVKDANDIITGGSLGGMLHSGDVDGDGMNAGKAMDCLNNIAQTLADIFNELNTRDGAYSINPNDTNKLQATTKDNYIFVGADGTGKVTAGDIQINPELLTDDGFWNIACAYFDDPANFDENAIGNAQNVVDMLKTRSGNYEALSGMSLEDYYTSFLGKLAAGGSNAQNMYDTQKDVVDSIYNSILANNGVDINEELVDLVKYQTAYAASAQVFNACNRCLDTLMTLGA